MDRKALLNTINHVKPGIVSNASLELLSHFYFSGTALVSYNDKISVLSPCETDFTAFIRATDLSNVVAKSSDEFMKMSLVKGKLNIKTKSMNVNLATLHDDELSGRLDNVAKSLEKAKWKPLPDNFAECVRLCSFAASSNESDLTLTCVRLSGNICVSSDNMRIAKANLSGEVDDMLLKASEIGHLTAISPTKYAVSKSWLHFKNEEGCVFSIRSIIGNYPDFLEFFAFEGTSINLPKELLVGADLASIFTDNIQPSVKITIENKFCTISVKADSGNIKHRTKIDYEGEAITFSINPDFLKEMLNHSSTIVIGKDKARLDTDKFSLVTAFYA